MFSATKNDSYRYMQELVYRWGERLDIEMVNEELLRLCDEADEWRGDFSPELDGSHRGYGAYIAGSMAALIHACAGFGEAVNQSALDDMWAQVEELETLIRVWDITNGHEDRG